MGNAIKILCCLALLTGWSTAAAAQDYRARTDHALYAGFYLTVPLGPRAREGSAQKLRFGFAAGPRFDLRTSRYDPTGRPTLQTRVIDMSFSPKGFERLSLAGTTLVGTKRYAGLLSADGDDNGDEEEGAKKKKGRSFAGTALLVGAIVVGGLLVLFLAASCGDKVFDKDDDKFLDASDFCPV